MHMIVICISIDDRMHDRYDALLRGESKADAERADYSPSNVH
jgi:hypothetical protein